MSGSSKASAVNRRTQSNTDTPTTSGSKFYASVIKSAVEQVENARRHKKLEDIQAVHKLSQKERKKASPRRKKDKFLSREISKFQFEQPKPPPYEMRIIGGLVLFSITISIACLLIATSTYHDEKSGFDITPMITASIFEISPKLSELRDAEMLENFCWIAVRLQVLVLPYIFPTPFSLILERFLASDKFQKISAGVCVCISVWVHIWTSYV